MRSIDSNYFKRLRWIRQLLWSGVFAVLLLGSMGTYPLTAQADNLSSEAKEPPSVFIQIHLKPANPVVGQQVEFQVDVFVDTWFTKAPDFPELQVEDAIALLPPSSSVNLNKRIDGKTYAGQRRTYFLFPQLPGRYELPELSVTVSPAQPETGASKPISLSTEPIDFLAQLPPELAAQGNDSILVTPQLQVNTHVATQHSANTAQLNPLHTGDTVERTITLTATNTLASMLPAIALTESPGLSAYPDPPKLTNQFDRGEFIASRSDRISYVAEKPGRYHLPAQSITWWNTRTQSLQTEVIPSVDLRVKPTLRQFLIQLLPWFAGLLASLSGLVYFRRSIQTTWQTYRRQRQDSEAAQWKHLCNACQQNDPQATWNALMHWLPSRQLEIHSMTLDSLLKRVDDSSLNQAVRDLEATLFDTRHAEDTNVHWSGQPLLAALSTVRAEARVRSHQRSDLATSLPPLNPPIA